MTNFKQLKIWHRGLDIAVKSFKPTKEFPKEEKFRISSQITRGGSQFHRISRKRAAEPAKRIYSRFIELAPGSSFE
jgi:four helix bundle protein